jgi:metal-responsive CopG/Arc/MetJ family transcriptional regulator
MKRATMSFPDDIAQALERYSSAQEVPPSLTAVVQAALRQYLTDRGFMRERKAFNIRPAARGSGYQDISENHDRYLAEHLK